MLNKLPSMAHLLKNLQHVPYLASKNLYRVASHFLDMNEQQLEQFCSTLLEARKNLVRCSRCFAWCQKGADCLFCDASDRDRTTICVVETWHELLAIEKTGGYTGLYHVLGGVICPLDGVGPEDLAIDALLDRTHHDEMQEIILATNQTPEGEATAAFIANKLKDSSIKISCLARGVPVGSSLEMMDRLTVYKALSERRLF